MSNVNLIKEYLDYRCSMYFWLKSLYINEPTKKTINEIVDICRKYDGEDCPKCEERFISFFSKIDKRRTDKLCAEIRAEYARLFLGPKHILASPYESVYTTSSRSIFGESCIKVKELYEKAGLKIIKKANIPDDFIGYELEFMYYLSYQSIKAVDNEDMDLLNKILKYQSYFIKEHLGKWITEFIKNIRENTNMEYFKVVSDFTEEFILSDYELIKELV